MSLVNSPSLILANAPCVFALALGMLLLVKGWAQAFASTLIAVGLSLCSLSLLTLVPQSFSPLSHFTDSPLFLLGIPLLIFMTAISLLLKRTRVPLLISAIYTVFGLVAFFGLSGFVMMQSTCSVHSGGC